MAKDIIPLVNDDYGNYNANSGDDVTIMYHNVSPMATGNGEWALTVRPLIGSLDGNPPSLYHKRANIDDNSRGRAITEFDENDFQTATETGWWTEFTFYELYSVQNFDQGSMADFIYHKQAGIERIVLVNPGQVNTNNNADGAVWWNATSGATPQQITDVDMPGNNSVALARGGASLDGYFFLCSIDGALHNSILNDLTSWESTGFLSAEREADTTIYCGKHRDHIFVMGTRSIEFFYNNAVAAPASPLARRVDIFFNVGCFHPNAILHLGNQTYFIGKSLSGATGVYRLENFGLEIIGKNPIVDKMIKSLEFREPVLDSSITDLQQDVYLSGFNSAQNGDFLLLTMSHHGTFALHLETNTWARWYTGGTPEFSGGIKNWEAPKVFPVVASLNKPGADQVFPNRLLFVNGLIANEIPRRLWFDGNVPGSDHTVMAHYSDTGRGVNGRAEISPIEFYSGQEACLSDDGLHAYMTGTENEIIYQYDFSTAFDITSGSYSGNSFDLGVEVGLTRGLYLGNSGANLFVSDITTNEVFMFILGTPYDISTATFTGGDVKDLDGLVTFASGSTIGGIHIKEDGINVYINAAGNTDSTVHQFTMATPWDIKTLTYDSKVYDYRQDLVDEAGGGVFLDSTGVNMWLTNDSGDTIHWYHLTTAFDLSTVVNYRSFFDYNEECSSCNVRVAISWPGFASSMPPLYLFLQRADLVELREYTNVQATPVEWEGTLDDVSGNAIGNPDFTVYTKPWDLDTNERKRINNVRILHYPDPVIAGANSDILVDWINTEDINDYGVHPASFSNDRTIDINSMTARLYRGGLCRQRIYKLSFTGTRTQIIKGLEIDYDPLRG